MEAHTGGGGVVGGDARSGKDFVGRDQYSHDNITNIKLGEDEQPRKNRVPLADRVDDLERYMYGDMRSGEPGLIKRAHTQLRWSQANTVLLVIVILMALALLNTTH